MPKRIVASAASSTITTDDSRITQLRDALKVYKVGGVQEVAITKLVTRPPFSTAYPRERELVLALAQSMRDHAAEGGFLSEHPIVAWPDGDRFIVISGHHRLDAAKQLGLNTVFARFRDFASDEEALQYAHREEATRRNKTARHYLHALRNATFDPTDLSAYPTSVVASSTHEAMARFFGIHESMAKRLAVILKEAPPEELDAILGGPPKGASSDNPDVAVPADLAYLGSMSVNQLYNRYRPTAVKTPQVAPVSVHDPADPAGGTASVGAPMATQTSSEDGPLFAAATDPEPSRSQQGSSSAPSKQLELFAFVSAVKQRVPEIAAMEDPVAQRAVREILRMLEPYAPGLSSRILHAVSQTE